MRQRVKGKNNRHFLTWIAITVSAVCLVVTVLLVTGGKSSESRAANELTFIESFATDTFKDAAATDAVWDTSGQLVELPKVDGSMYEADRSTPGADAFTTTTLDYVLNANNDPELAGGIAVAGQLAYARWSEPIGNWTGADGSNGIEDLSVDLGTAADNVQAVAIDIKGTGEPVIIWERIRPDTSRELNYSEWDVTQGAWVDIAGTPGYTQIDVGVLGEGYAYLDLKTDSQDRPHVLYGKGSTSPSLVLDLHYQRWDGSAWQTIGGSSNVTGTGTFTTGSSPTLTKIEVELDITDQPHIVYEDNASGDADVYYLVGDIVGDVWKDVTGATYDASCLATTCAAANVSNNAGISRSPTLALTSDGRPFMAWSDNEGLARPEIFATQRVGSTWVKMDGTTAGFEQVTTSAVLGGANPGAVNPTIGLDNDRPILVQSQKIAAFGRGIYGERYDQGSGMWVDFDRTIPGQTTIFEQASGNPQFMPPILEVDTLGNAATAWLNIFPTSVAKFARWLNPVVSAQAQSVPVDTVTQNIVSVTLSAIFLVDGESTTFYVSNDESATFFPVVPGVEHVFTTVGDKLKWKASLSADPGDVSFTPIIDEVQLTYKVEAPTGLEIKRVSGEDPTEESIAVSHARFPSADSALLGFVSRDELLVDAFTVSPLVSRTGGTLMLNQPSSLEPTVLAELQRALPDGAPVIVVGGSTAISSSVEQSLKDAGFAVTRIGNVNRRGTAADLARELISRNGGSTKKCFLTEDVALVDALGAGAIAGNLADTFADCILLSQRGNNILDNFTKTYLDQHSDLVALEIIGGNTALPTALEDALRAAYPALTITRTQGVNRFATNVALVQAHFTNPTALTVASGRKESIPGARSQGIANNPSTLYFDALLAGPFAAQHSIPLVLVSTNTLPPEVAAYFATLKGNVTLVTIIGSLAEVSQAIEEVIRTSLQL